MPLIPAPALDRRSTRGQRTQAGSPPWRTQLGRRIALRARDLARWSSRELTEQRTQVRPAELRAPARVLQLNPGSLRSLGNQRAADRRGREKLSVGRVP